MLFESLVRHFVLFWFVWLTVSISLFSVLFCFFKHWSIHALICLYVRGHQPSWNWELLHGYWVIGRATSLIHSSEITNMIINGGSCSSAGRDRKVLGCSSVRALRSAGDLFRVYLALALRQGWDWLQQQHPSTPWKGIKQLQTMDGWMDDY